MHLNTDGVSGSTGAYFNKHMNEPPGTASRSLVPFWNDVIGGQTASGLPNYLMRLYKNYEPDTFAVYYVYGGGASASHAGSTLTYEVPIRFYHGSANGDIFDSGAGDDVIATFSAMPEAAPSGGGGGGGGVGGSYYYNFVLAETDGISMGGLTIENLPGTPTEGFLPPAYNHGTMWRFAYGAVETGGDGRVSGPTGEDSHGMSFAGHASDTTDAHYSAHFRFGRYDGNGLDLTTVIGPNGPFPTSLTKIRLHARPRTIIPNRPWSLSAEDPGHWVEFECYGDDGKGSIDYFGTDDHNEIGITVGNLVAKSWTTGSLFTDLIWQIAGPGGLSPNGNPLASNNGIEDGKHIICPITMSIFVASLPGARSGAGVPRSDGSNYVIGTSLTHLDDISSSLASQISSEGSKGGVLSTYAQSPNRQDAVSLKYDPDANVFVAQEVGINDYTVIPFRIESAVPIVAGDEKILRTIPFNSEIDSVTLFVPEGVASGKITIGLDKWEPGASYPAAAQKVDVIGASPTNSFNISASGNTFYNGITYGDIWNAGTSWAQPSLAAGSILSINVNANTANVNTIIGDIALKRIS